MTTPLQNYNLVAIAGLANSGKTEASNMLCFILNAPKPFRSYRWYKCLKKWPFRKNWEITAFAKPLKQTLSIILNKPLEWFENRENKESVYVDLNSLKTYSKSELNYNWLTESKFQKLLKTENPISSCYVLSVRQLMQYYGTSVIRKFLGDNTWINATLNKVYSKNIIVSDLRFKVELSAIKKKGGCTIYINRSSAKPGTHASEREVLDMNENKEFDFIISNDGSLEDLFNNLKSLC